MKQQTDGERIARTIFEIGEEGLLKINRIEYKSVMPGMRNEEIGCGGLCESALAEIIDKELAYLQMMRGQR